MSVSVIIPTLNEESHLGATIDAAFAAGAAEVIVCDGGSSDATIAIADEHGARVIEGERRRARQLNRGAAEARHEWMLFLHADTLLPAGACEAIERSNADFGAFRFGFIERGWRLSVVAFLANLRDRITRVPWGDRGHFTRRSAFEGYPDLPLMEDYELARRMRKRAALLPLTVRTSGRRFLRKGVFRTSLINKALVFAYRCGVPAERLAEWYRR
jgi:rSAM/selenodomain-associated transferase 2